MDDREPGAYCFANEPEDIGLVCCGQTRETKAAQSSTASVSYTHLTLPTIA